MSGLPSSATPTAAAGRCSKSKTWKKHFQVYKGMFSRISGHVYAVDRMSFHPTNRGKRLAWSAKAAAAESTVGRTLLKLLEPTEGKIRVHGKDITDLDTQQMFPYREQMQMIYQDPYASLNPRMSAGDIVGEPLIIHHVGQQRRTQGPGRRPVRARRPATGAHDLVPARVLRRPAAAHRHRPRAGPGSGTDRRR